MKSLAWSRWLKEARDRKGLTKREVAKLADIDPSYMTLLEKDGLIPKPDVAIRVIANLTSDPIEADTMMLLIGFAPFNASAEEVIAALLEIRSRRGNTRTGRESPRVVPAD